MPAWRDWGAIPASLSAVNAAERRTGVLPATDRCAIIARPLGAWWPDAPGTAEQADACRAFLSLQSRWREDVFVQLKSDEPADLRARAELLSVGRVVVWDPRVLGGSSREWVDGVAPFIRDGGEVVAVGPVRRSGDIAACDLVVSQLRRSVASLQGEALADARRERRRRGKRASGRVPFGFVSSKIDADLVPEPEESVVVAELFSMVASGMTPRDTASALTRRGYRTRPTSAGLTSFWSARSVLQVVRNPAYVGAARIGDVIVPHAHRALVSQESFDAANASVSARSSRRRTETEAGTTVVDSPPVRYALEGKVVCGRCGGHAIAVCAGSSASGRPSRSYRCGSSPLGSVCLSASAPLVERRVATQVILNLERRNVLAVAGAEALTMGQIGGLSLHAVLDALVLEVRISDAGDIESVRFAEEPLLESFKSSGSLNGRCAGGFIPPP